MGNKSLVFLLMLDFFQNSTAQISPCGGVLDPNASALEKKPIPYTYLREANVMWTKRVWRKIELREKVNQVFYYPATPSGAAIDCRANLMSWIYTNVMGGANITAYAENNEGEFSIENIIPKEELEKKLNTIDTIPVENPDGTVENKIVENIFDPSKVIEFKIKEDWFFDKERSVLECRIIGLAPVMETEKNDEIRKETLFWIYFPEARNMFANILTYNRFNDAERRTYDEIFWKRQFGSYIYKESNVYDRKILEYCQGMDELLEAERVKSDIFNFEHDLWEY
jgi:gliding motility associated protien GldN